MAAAVAVAAMVVATAIVDVAGDVVAQAAVAGSHLALLAISALAAETRAV